MGATVTCNKKIAAFKSPSGIVFYIAFEETYEKRDYPHTPKWQCIAFGTYQYVMKRIYLHASACEGGDLQTRSGHTTPENYLKSWFRAFNNPVRYDAEQPFKLKIDSQWSAPISKDAWPFVEKKLHEINRRDLIDQLAIPGQSIELSLTDDLTVFNALYGENGVIPPWRIFTINGCGELGYEDLRPVSQTCSQPQARPHYQFYRLDSNNILQRTNDQLWVNVGWQYSVVGGFIKEIAYPVEMESTGSSLALITAFRMQIRNASALPEDTQVHITINPAGVESYSARQAIGLAEMLGVEASAESFTVLFSRLNYEAVAQLMYLNNLQVRWEIPALHEENKQLSQPIIQNQFSF